MSFKVMGIAMYNHSTGKKLKIVGRKNGVISSYVVQRPNEKINLQSVINIAAEKMKCKTDKIKVPKHIECALKERE